jgi:hypothetical protein
VFGLGGFGGFPFGDHAVELAGEVLDLAHGRANSRREQGVLGRVFGEGCNQGGEECSERLSQGGSLCPFHVRDI